MEHSPISSAIDFLVPEFSLLNFIPSGEFSYNDSSEVLGYYSRELKLIRIRLHFDRLWALN